MARTYSGMAMGQLHLLRQSLLRFFQDKRVKVSLFLQVRGRRWRAGRGRRLGGRLGRVGGRQGVIGGRREAWRARVGGRRTGVVYGTGANFFTLSGFRRREAKGGPSDRGG